MPKKLTYEYVKNYFKENGCELLSTKYINSRSFLKYLPQCGHEQYIYLSNFKSGQGRMCSICTKKIGSEKRRLSYEDVKNCFKENGCELLSESYGGNKLKLKYLARCGHEHCISLKHFKLGKGRMCPKCAMKEVGDKKKLSYENVKKTFKESGCKLLSKNYANALTKMKYIAKCGHEHFIALGHFKSGKGRACPKCAAPRGKDNHMWNPNLTNEDRISRRDISENVVWRKGVYERDNYTCQITGKKCSGDIVAHHLKPYYKYKDLRFDISNGITLNKEFHIFAHKIFGFKAEIDRGDLIEVKYLWDHRKDS